MLAMDHIEAPFLRDLKLDGGDVAVIGAYKGDTVAFIREHHPESRVFAYEPQVWAYHILSNRFTADDKVHCYNYGVGTEAAENMPLYEYETDAASLLEIPNWRKRDYVGLLDARALLGPRDSNSMSGRWALILMNIEGYEYQLIPYMLSLGIHPKNWLVQCHHLNRFYKEIYELRIQIENLDYYPILIGSGWFMWVPA